MGKSFSALLGLGAIAFSGMISAKPEPSVSFNRQIIPIFERECAFCHTSGEPYAGLILEPASVYDQIVSAPSTESEYLRVEPKRPEKSYLYLKLIGQHAKAGGSGTRMPPGWQSLSPNDLNLIRRWIAAGAPKN